jgi:hypothetical protein
MIPTAEEFLKQQDCIRNVEDFFNDVQPIDLIKFAKLHVEAALKEAEKEMSKFVDVNEIEEYKPQILKVYPLTNIK